MKKIIYLSLLVFCSYISQAQIHNGDFELWRQFKVNDGVDVPKGWSQLVSQFSIYKVVNPFTFNTSLELGTFCHQCMQGATNGTYSAIAYGEMTDSIHIRGNLWTAKAQTFSKIGVAYQKRPLGFQGNYILFNNANKIDSGRVEIYLKKYNPKTQATDTIAFIKRNFAQTAVKSIYTSFYFPFQYLSDQIPDTISIFFLSTYLGRIKLLNNDLNCEMNDSQFEIDDLKLVDDPNGIAVSQSSQKSLTIYPNPAHQVLHISAKHRVVSAIVYNSKGSKVLETQVKDTIDIGTLPQGLYLLEAIDEQGNRYTSKFEKE